MPEDPEVRAFACFGGTEVQAFEYFGEIEVRAFECFGGTEKSFRIPERSGDQMNIQWYPGHMTKARRQMQEDIKLVDLVIEIVDARVPVSSRNPDIDELGKNKQRLLILNKADLADEKRNDEWTRYFKNAGFYVVKADSRKSSDMKAVQNALREAGREKRERDLKRGIKNRPIRAMVAGIPNVGKSTFINSFAGRACTRTGNKPGVTKGVQWIRLSKEAELLDTPGILWPKFDDPTTGIHLAFIGSVKDEVINLDELSLLLISFLKEEYPGVLTGRYGVREDSSPAEILTEIGRARGCIKKGEEIDYTKACSLFMDDYRSGRLGRITLEKVPGQEAPARGDENEDAKQTR